MKQAAAIIVNYNAGPALSGAVNSLLDSDSIARIIVVDNGSGDGSLEEIEKLAASQSRLICLRNHKNLGFAKACNIGVAAADTGEYLLFLNPDCIVEKGAVEKLMSGLESLPESGMAGPLLLNPDGTEQAGGRRAVPTPWRSFVAGFGFSRLGKMFPGIFSDFLLHDQPLPESPVDVEAISGSCMLVKREALDDVGPLDEGYFLHCEDLDWCMRFRQTGWKVIFIPDARVIHHKGVCSAPRPIFVEWNKHKGMLRFYNKFFRKQYPFILSWIIAAGIGFRFAAVAVYYGAMGLRQRLKKNA